MEKKDRNKDRNDEGEVVEDARFRNPAGAGKKSAHIPVLLNEVLEKLALSPGKFIVDGTLGGGGHASAIIEKIKPNGMFLGLDWDRNAVERFKRRTENIHGLKHMVLREGNYADMSDILVEEGLPMADGVLLDIGFSSEQLSDGKGFSFQKDEPLLMTYNEDSLPAYKVLRQLDESELGDMIRELSDERYARRIAGAIWEAEHKQPIKTSGELAQVIEDAVPGNYEHGRINPATRTFMALRMYVNDELRNLNTFLERIRTVVAPGGRVVIISFHSKEDRLVKLAFKKLSALGDAKIITKKPITATEEEMKQNPRSRSAKLRVIEF